MTRRSVRTRAPYVVGIGGSSRTGSGTDLALLAALREAERAGAATRFFGGAFLAQLPLYTPDIRSRTPQQAELLAAIAMSDGLVIATPSYHGNVSSLVKNALDLLEDLSAEPRPYLEGRAVGCIVAGVGPQAGGATLSALWGSVHALRGWPTSLGVVLNTSKPLFGVMGGCSDATAAEEVQTMARQVVEFALGRMLLEGRADVERPALRLVT